MMKSPLAFACLALVAVGQAQTPKDVQGKWNGVLKITPGKGPDGKPLPMQGGPGAVKYELELKANGVYTTAIKGTPDKIDHTSEGTWVMKGSTLTLTVQKRDGKPDQSEPKVRILKLSSDKKTLTTSMQGQVQVTDPNGKKASIKGFVPPMVTIVFKRG